MGCSDVLGLLQDHRLKDDEPLQVSQSVPHPPQLLPERPNKAPPESPARRVIEPQWHDRDVTSPRLPRSIIVDASVKVGARVGMTPGLGRIPDRTPLSRQLETLIIQV